MRARVVLGFACFLGACATEAPSESTDSSTVVVHNRLSANRLSANRLSANRLSANQIAGGSLAENRFSLNSEGAAEMLSTADGREVLSYIVSCALRDGVTLVGEHDGVTYEFFGEIGLASQWLHRRLDSHGKNWVSACLFARVNVHDVALPISLRGPHHQLAATDDEKAGWSLEEGAFFGNLFTPVNEPIDWNACRGRDQASGEGGGLAERDCAEPDPANPGKTYCGFNYAGDCGTYAPDFDATPACTGYSENGTYYRRCSTDGRGNGHGNGHGGWKHGGTYHQVITTFTVE